MLAILGNQRLNYKNKSASNIVIKSLYNNLLAQHDGFVLL